MSRFALPDEQSHLCRQRGIIRSAAAVQTRSAHGQQATAAPSRVVARMRCRDGLLDPAGVHADRKGGAALASRQEQPLSTWRGAMAVVVVAAPASVSGERISWRRWLVSGAQPGGRRCDVSGCD